MEQDYLLVDGLATVAEMLADMIEKNVAYVFVQKRDEFDEFGVVLVSDIAKKVLAQHRAPERINIYEIMTKPVLSVQPEMDIRYCARLFEQFGISTAPVIKDGEILGVVTYEELVLQGLARLG
jgi:predicted transcriptional regulator